MAQHNTWTCKAEPLESSDFYDRDDFVDRLNSEAHDGWEFVAVVPLHVFEGADPHNHIVCRHIRVASRDW